LVLERAAEYLTHVVLAYFTLDIQSVVRILNITNQKFATLLLREKRRKIILLTSYLIFFILLLVARAITYYGNKSSP
jgi:hypothetical protein